MAKQAITNQIQEISSQIEKGIQELFESEKYRQYLTTMSRFPSYSFRNTVLINMQRPDATMVAGYNKWEKAFSRRVLKGEKGIKIIAPTTYTKKIQAQKVDPDTHLPVLDAEGKPVTEEKSIKVPHFKVVSVFDVSQTFGKELPQLAASLSGNVENYEIFMEALGRTSPVPIEVKPIAGDMDGYFNIDTQSIAIREGMSQVQTVCAGIHEVSHAKLHNYDHADESDNRVEKDRRTEEVEAESISYTVCQYFGIETSENSFGYIAQWSQGKELKELQTSLETINKTASELISGIEEQYQQICQERGIDLTTESEVIQESQAMPIPEEPPFPEKLTEEVPTVPFYDNTVPDPLVTQEFMREYGYKDMDILPMSQDRARELFSHDVSLYMLYFTGTEDMVLSEWDIEHHDALFGISQDDWDYIKDKVPHRDVEQRFLDCSHNAFAIYQLRPEAPADLAGASFGSLAQPPNRENYKAVYVHGLNPGEDTLDNLYSISDRITAGAFEDFTGNKHHTGDIIALKQNGIVSYHYCDYGDHDCFKELHNFQKPENHLRAAEMSTEDDYGMIDGIINNGKQPTVAELEQQAKSGTPISLMDLADAIQREKKQSVLKQLKPATKKPPSTEKAKKKSEREI